MPARADDLSDAFVELAQAKADEQAQVEAASADPLQRLSFDILDVAAPAPPFGPAAMARLSEIETKLATLLAADTSVKLEEAQWRTERQFLSNLNDEGVARHFSQLACHTHPVRSKTINGICYISG